MGIQCGGQTNIPAGLSNVVAIAAGAFTAWRCGATGQSSRGETIFGETNIPAGLSNVVAIAAGRRHSLALWRQAVPAQVALLTGNNAFEGSVTAASFIGNGSGLTSLNASQLSSGTVLDARLSTNVSLLGSSIDPPKSPTARL